MSSKIPVDFYPKHVYCCPCLARLFEKIYTKYVVREYLQILQSIESPPKVFTTPLANDNCIIVCVIHLEHFLLAETVFECTSEEGERRDYWFEGLQKRYCKSCIKQYIRKISTFYPFKVFNE